METRLGVLEAGLGVLEAGLGVLEAGLGRLGGQTGRLGGQTERLGGQTGRLGGVSPWARYGRAFRSGPLNPKIKPYTTVTASATATATGHRPQATGCLPLPQATGCLLFNPHSRRRAERGGGYSYVINESREKIMISIKDIHALSLIHI